MNDFVGPRQLTYMPDTNVISMVLDGDAIVIGEVRSMRARGIAFVVPAQVMTELRNDTDATRRAAHLAFIRDFGMGVQERAAGPVPDLISGSLRAAMVRANPQLRNQTITPNMASEFLARNPDVAQRLAGMQSPVGRTDRLVVEDIRRYDAMEGAGKDVQFLTYERLAGQGPQGSAGQKRRIAEELGVTVAIESRRLQRQPKLIEPEQLWEIMPELRGRPVTRTVIDPTGALGRPASPPRMPSTPSTSLQFRGTIGMGLKAAGLVLLQIIFQIVVLWIFRKQIEKAQQEVLAEDTARDVRPQLLSALDPQKEKVLNLLADNKKAYAKIVVRYYHMDVSGGGIPLGGQLPSQSEFDITDPYEHVRFDRLIGIVDKPMDEPERAPFFRRLLNGEKPPFINFDATYSGELTTSTIELTYSQEEIELYRNYRDIIGNCMLHYMMCDESFGPVSDDPAVAKRFWAAMHQFFVRALAESLRLAPRPTML